MNLTSGELYFINECDVLTGEALRYFKIGLVRDVRQGDAGTRVDEHQTGNPRRLVIVDRIDAPAISDLEATIHNRFARQRVLGEWFVFDDAQLAEAIATARTLATEQDVHLPAMQQAAEFTRVESNGIVRSATTDDVEWHRCALAAKETEGRVRSLRNRSEEVFKAALDRGAEVGLFAGWTPKVRRQFDREAFGEAHPELLAQFTLLETKLTPRFTLQRPKDAAPAIGDDSELADFERRFIEALDRAEAGDADFRALHLLHLELLSFQARSKWEADLAESNLKALCGADSGIEGVATWNRSIRESERFDDAALRREFPEVHAQFTQEHDTRSFAVVPMRSYAFD